MNEKFLKPYNPQETENRIYKLWEESGFFNPDNLPDKGKEFFSIAMPPPNVTGTLHLGHALEDSIQDMIVRYNRMLGKKVLWLPGTDHAAIATQSKVEKEIQKKEGKSRYDLGREEMLKRIEKFAKESHDTIVTQIRTMGASCDWSREAFTLDEKRNLAVRTAFKKMYDEGLIYRGNRIVNWDPKGQTTISDDEIVYEERKAKMYTFKYSKDFPISISTTRPETKVGDTAVAVHPDDKRYKKYVGKIYTIEDFCGVKLEIKIIADETVEKDFGTGALGVTPAHSQTDAEIAIKHKLPSKQVINEFAKMIVGDERILNKKTIEARETIVNWLKENDLLEKEEEITQNVSTAERTGAIIEPLLKLQWFIDVNKKIPERNNKSLKELMLEPVGDEKIKILPNHFEKVYFNWIENLRDWCISRQIWYGHRIPVWYKDKEIYCGIEEPKEKGWTQDEDTLDTWFSSGLWTFSTLGWPEKTEDLKNFHPTALINPGYEILFFWVARMILMSQFLLGEIPFKTIFLHGMLRDKNGKKFSKSSGNNIDPVEIIKKYGADALRMSLISGTGVGSDSNFDENKVKGYKNFANKIWNITRFILENTKEIKDDNPSSNELTKEFKSIAEDITSDMENYRFHLAAEKIYQYIWHRFADEILEESKEIIKQTSEKAEERKKSLLIIWTDCLKILHPFMPFVSEEIWQTMGKEKLLMIEKWPND